MKTKTKTYQFFASDEGYSSATPFVLYNITHADAVNEAQRLSDKYNSTVMFCDVTHWPEHAARSEKGEYVGNRYYATPTINQ